MNILVLNTLAEVNFPTFFTEDVQERLAKLGNVLYWNYSRNEENKAELNRRIVDVDVLITGWGVPNLDADFYAAAKNLKMIAHTGGSVGDLANAELEKSGVVLLSGNRYYAESVAQGTILYMLLGQRRLYPILKGTEQGWFRGERTDGLRGKTIGLVSFGMISKHVARMLQVFDCKVKVYSSHGLSEREMEEYHVESCPLEELFATCDIVSVHSGLTDKTYHMVDARLLGLMKDDALIVNTARGAVIDETALEKEVATGRLRAVLDVFETEPLPMDSMLRNLDNVVVVPHMGGPTTDVRRLVSLGLIDDIARFFNGERRLKNEISVAYAKNMTSHSMVSKHSHNQFVL